MSERPLLRIVRGDPDEAELAALIAVVATASAPRDRPANPRRRSWWSDRAALLRCEARPGEGAWRASSLPR